MKILPTEHYKDYAIWLQEKVSPAKVVGYDPLLVPGSNELAVVSLLSNRTS